MTAPATHRSAEEIGRTTQGPRPLPPLGEQRAASEPLTVDTVLPNGLRVLAVHRPAVPMVELRLRIPFAGEESTHSARAELLSTTMLTGTQRRDRVRVDTDLARVGGELDAVVDPERLSIGGSALVDGMDVLFDVLADVLTGATYPDDEVRRERERLVERITVARSQPRVIAREALQRHRYGDHPFTREMPSAEDVARVTAEDVRELHARAVLPRGSAMVLVGDIDPQRAVDAVAAAFHGWNSDRSAVELPPLPEVPGGDLLLVHRPGAVQSQIRLSAPFVSRTDPAYPALQLANLVFGGYFSSRLVENIREDKGYTYSAHSYPEFTPGGATVLVDADTASEATAPALLETRYEIARMAVVPPSESEVDSARRYAVGGLLTSTASQAGLASMLMSLAGMGLGPEWLREHPGRLQRVTVDEVAEAALRLFTPSRWTGVLVGDADRLSAPLTALGGVRLP
ncbi:putative Zn-dependent peptidase [Streptoalloteichus tenebrarius]|uniref:Zn-dependent peptidase n=2 Tax=Actinomycetes TaxID=1760 RepID=A0ABT1HVT2_STRSD|nr:pitrilysin family protein [Streptoalloteichus tenebrarius]MCP2259637.1 putative Zn-dependent peptidase [Streptoalloteichus tenebrarius]BFF00957.1 pitrilysin family protein [Streptoalloteichus tenebrarius]